MPRHTSPTRRPSTVDSPAERPRDEATGRAAQSRTTLLATAERLFAEHGIVAVSNRQISEAAGQGNNSAVGYHFGTKLDLVQAVARRHTDDIDHRREEMAVRAAGSTDVRDWVDCMVRPTTDHLDSLEQPTWYGRFVAQLITDPALTEVVQQEALETRSLQRVLEGLERCRPDLPADVRIERDDMARQLIVHTVADRERALANGRPTPRTTWSAAATGLVDAITGLWLAPWTSSDES
ncbi:TetR family transcriptional regulator [Rathayibacter tanaceti]|uniref:TetR family transcriptional regulator n=2 Tax=Rathayibacter tanaceti TaxID=1671680 RepID=A0AAE6RMA7_9MICO|nr:TetR family transcriptional regulator [Rathayibacter tanaceti]